ncbi:MAG: GTPase [Hyphomicrobiaceae bacterium]
MTGASQRQLETIDTREATLAWLRRGAVELAIASSVAPECARAARAFRALSVHLSRPPRVAILGESNTGKSTLANHLAQNALLPTSVFQSTRLAKLLRYADRLFVEAHMDDHTAELRSDVLPQLSKVRYLEIGLPLHRLRDFELIDMPAVDAADAAETAELLERLKPDLLVFCSAGVQAWKESERQHWRALKGTARGGGLLVLTHMDLLAPQDRQSVFERVKQLAGAQFAAIACVGLVEESVADTQDADAPKPVDLAVGAAPDGGTGSLGLSLILDFARQVERRRISRIRRIAQWIAGRSRRSLDHRD